MGKHYEEKSQSELSTEATRRGLQVDPTAAKEQLVKALEENDREQNPPSTNS